MSDNDAIKRLYVAGPMSGLEDFNYPAFRLASSLLRKAGYEVESPAENPPPASGDWADWMRLGIAQVLRVDGVATLPDWGESRGATLEVHVAHALGISVAPVKMWLLAGERETT